MGKKKYQFDVFLSYAHVDAEWVDKLKSALEDRGVTVWRDKENIRPGDYFAEALEKGIESSRTVVIAITSASLKSKWVSEEYRRALTLANQRKTRIIACILGDVEVPGFLSSREYINFSQESDFDFNVDRLIWPGIMGKKIDCMSFDHGNRRYEALHNALSELLIHCGRLGSTRMHEWFPIHTSKRETYGHQFFPKDRTCGVLFIDIFSDELFDKSSLEFILKCRNSDDGINENIVFVFYHESGWLEKLRELQIPEELVKRLSHYFVVEKTEDKDELKKRIRSVWNLVQQDIMRKEKLSR